MKNVYFTVGPSQMYPVVPKLIERAVREEVPSLFHRGEEFEELYLDVVSLLRSFLGIPRSHKIFFLSSASECMERVIENTVVGKSAHVVTGEFGNKFHDIAVLLGKATEKHEVGVGDELGDVELGECELIAFTQNDTSTGYRIAMQHISEVADAYPDALVAVDAVSSMPYAPIDYGKADMVFFSLQKGFGLPAGLAVLVVSPRAFERGVSLDKSDAITGSYHNFVNLNKYAEGYQTFETPNVLGIYLLRGVLEDMNRRGIEKIRYETEEKDAMLYDFFEENGSCEVVVRVPEFQSITTPVVEVNGGSVKLLSALKKHGLVVSAGYGGNKKKHMRVANFPAQSIDDTKRLISEMRKIL